MGRTTPSIRMAIEKETRRIEKMLEYTHEPYARKALEEILEGYRELLPVFQAVPPDTPSEALLLTAIAKIYKRLIKLENKMDPEDNAKRKTDNTSTTR